jgi:hypothetical protein
MIVVAGWEAFDTGLLDTGGPGVEDSEREDPSAAWWKELRKEADAEMGPARGDNGKEVWKYCLDS